MNQVTKRHRQIAANHHHGKCWVLQHNVDPKQKVVQDWVISGITDDSVECHWALLEAWAQFAADHEAPLLAMVKGLTEELTNFSDAPAIHTAEMLGAARHLLKECGYGE